MTLALDIGGTNIRSAIVRKTKIKNRKEIRTPKKKEDITRAIVELISSYGVFKSIGVSTAGFEMNEMIVGALNMDYNKVPLSRILRKRFRVPVFVENDGNCAGLAELHYGVGRGKENFVLLTLGSGIGGAIIIDGKLYRGCGAAGEVGSMRIEGEMYEHLASGNGSMKVARKMGFKRISSLELERLADKGDKKARAVYNKVGYYLGTGLVNLAFIFSLDLFVLGGGFSRVKYIYPEMRNTLKKFYWINPKLKVVKAKFGVDAGLVGAGLLAKVSSISS